jgi:uncharacterized repeat protein (TIGR02543 family)
MRLLAISVLLSFVLTNCPTQGDTELVDMTASVEPSDAGDVNPPSGTYSRGQQITVETSASDQRWEFTGWSGDTTASADSLSFVIERDMNLVANYEIPSDERPLLVTSADPAQGGTVSPDSSSYSLGETVEVSASAAEGWQFTGWAGDTTSTANPLALTMNKDYQLTAQFEQVEPNEFMLLTSAKPTEGGSIVPAEGSFEAGTGVSVEAQPAEGWNFESWSGDTTTSSNPLELVMDKNYSVTANFVKQVVNLSTSVDPIGGGTVSPENGSYDYGSSVEVSATPSDGWQFVSWAGDTTVSTNPLTVTMDNDYELTAQFEEVEPEEFMLAATAQPTEGGSVSPSSGSFTEGTMVDVEAQPATGWNFDGWSGDTTASGNPLELVMDKNYEVTANFAKQSFQLATAADPAQGGSVVPESGDYKYGTDLEVKVTPSQGWQFISWSGDTTVSANPINVTINKDYNLTALVEKKTYQVVTSASPSEGGTVSPESGSFEYGTQLEVDALPESGWRFTGWSGDTTATSNPISVFVDKDYELTANFEERSQPFTNRIVVSDGQSSKEVLFGMASNATAGYDSGLDVELPPRPPSGNFYRRFNIPDYGLKEDYRPVSDQRTVWELEFAPETGQTITLSWDFTDTQHVGRLILVDDPENPSVEIDMKSQNTHEVSDQSMDRMYIISENQ